MIRQIVSTIIFAVSFGPPVLGASKKKRTQVVPEITYRQAYIEERPESSLRRTTQKNYVDQLYLSLKLVKTFDYVNEVVLEPAVRSPRTDPGAPAEVVVDQGYVSAQVAKFDFTAGRKAEYEGTGYFVNPSDLLNEDKDLFDPLYQRRGQFFTRARWNFHESWNASLGIIPQTRQAARYAKAWFQTGGEIAETDIRMQYTYNFRELSTFGLSASRFFGDWFELHLDSRYQQRQRGSAQEPERIVFDCESVEATRRINSAIIDSKPDYELECLEPTTGVNDGSFYTVLGSRFVLSPKRTIIAEAIQNQGGVTADESEMYYKYVQTERDGSSIEPLPQTRIIGRQYWFAAYQDEETLPRTLFNLAYLYRQDDQSSFLNTELRYTFNPIANVSIVNSQFLGSRYSEFGEAPAEQVTYLIVRGRF
jgi:hypothetical protein